ncbi:MAG TPA: sodium:calcium antiporter, partial [Nitrospiria bacterium]
MTGLLLLGLLIILGGAYLFTNGVEWVGKRLRLSEGVVGSVLAGVGTAMPETMVPVIAIFFG